MVLNEFYEKIMERIISNVPEVKHFDLYFRQDEPQTDEDELPFNRPAVLFEFEPFEYQTLGNKKKESDIKFKLHIISDVIQEVDNRTAPAIRNLGHEHLQLIDKIDYWMQGYNELGFNSIGSVGVIPYQPNKMLIKHISMFKTRLTNNAAKHTLVIPPTLPEDDTTISNDITP